MNQESWSVIYAVQEAKSWTRGMIKTIGGRSQRDPQRHEKEITELGHCFKTQSRKQTFPGSNMTGMKMKEKRPSVVSEMWGNLNIINIQKKGKMGTANTSVQKMTVYLPPRYAIQNQRKRDIRHSRRFLWMRTGRRS